MQKPKLKTVNVTCPHDCPDTCSLKVTVDTTLKKAIHLTGDNTHPITKGFLCNKVNHYLDLVYNENRVLYPHIRIGPKGKNAKFKRVSWDHALKLVTKNLKDTEKFYIEKVKITGNLITSERVIRNALISDEGDPFNELLVNKSYNNIRALGLFKDVKTNVETNENKKQK